MVFLHSTQSLRASERAVRWGRDPVAWGPWCTLQTLCCGSMDLGPRPWLQHVAAAIGCLPSCLILSLAVSWRFSLANGGTCDAPSLFFLKCFQSRWWLRWLLGLFGWHTSCYMALWENRVLGNYSGLSLLSSSNGQLSGHVLPNAFIARSRGFSPGYPAWSDTGLTPPLWSSPLRTRSQRSPSQLAEWARTLRFCSLKSGEIGRLWKICKGKW